MVLFHSVKTLDWIMWARLWSPSSYHTKDVQGKGLDGLETSALRLAGHLPCASLDSPSPKQKKKHFDWVTG